MKYPVILGLAAAGALATAAPALAIDYPAPTDPGQVQSAPKGPHHTLKVGPHARFHSIQKAVDAAKAGDTVKLADGRYRESVKIIGANRRYLRLIGNKKDPRKVVLDGTGLKGAKAQNGVMVNSADQVTIQGLTAKNWKGNGVFLLNATGYLVDKARAMHDGTYGIYAFNSRGGTMSNSVGAWNNDSGFYIGQTPVQTKPIRSLVTNVKSYGNTLGFSGTNMRYVTITRSEWFDNGIGIVPNALDSEKWAPPEDNVITDNDIYWNNFNYYRGAPFTLERANTSGVPFPVGVGVFLFGGRRTLVENNRIFGNYLAGVVGVQQLLLKQRDAQELQGNQVVGNQFGKHGTDLNGRDLFYDGDGQGNCFSGNEGVHATYPDDAETFPACPFGDANKLSGDTQQTAVSWTLADPTHEANWIDSPHAAIPGRTPLEHWTPKTGEPVAGASAVPTRTVAIRDNYFSPSRLTVKAGTAIKWVWADGLTNTHDVMLAKHPRGVATFMSDYAAGSYSFKRRLVKPGTYTFVCELHQDMKMSVVVKRA
ncbi:MAG TPA: right-handed parallel beta-helix repeat-containing protein [Thermoleophilaceae bacterium]|jgi:plastocyanin|nr:right-handed parallel beta-helix repeat-containing protein [Thermoleophilaceae bacterium]